MELEDDYLCDALSKHVYNPDLSPTLGTNLEGLSDAMIITAGYDTLRDEGTFSYHRILNMFFSKEKMKTLRDVIDSMESHQLHEN
ncbi:unnamed protein product [Brugia pahangi]|uniref:Abhydrolase_3 domain-containing protein n=1 Tax=Brugia pahangi TaxID=6280 RepID=A0A0N4T2V5_BRUPA|nr:unnamed protein product [Brugia pahangi]